MKKRLTFRNLDVVVKRLPLLDKTNKLEMEKCEKRVKSTTQKKGHKVLKVSDNVPYLGVENVCSNQNAYTENTKVPNNSKVVYTDNSFRSRNRIRMKPKCCGCNCTESDNTKKNNSKSISIITNVDENKSTSESVVSKTKDTLCHDPKSNLQCIVILERINFTSTEVGDDQTMDFSKSCANTKVKNKIPPKKKDTENKNVQNESQKKTSRVIWQDKILDKITLTPPLKFLRKQTKPNYAEITLDITKENTSSDTKQNCPATKVPIYRQHIEEKKGKIPDNLYDFDESDSNGHIKKVKKKRAPRKLKKQGITNFFSQKQPLGQTKGKTRTVKKSPRKYDEVVQQIMLKVMEKVSTDNKKGSKEIIDGKEPKLVASIVVNAQTLENERENMNAQNEEALIESFENSENAKKKGFLQSSNHNLTQNKTLVSKQSIPDNVPIQKVTSADINSQSMDMFSESDFESNFITKRNNLTQNRTLVSTENILDNVPIQKVTSTDINSQSVDMFSDSDCEGNFITERNNLLQNIKLPNAQSTPKRLSVQKRPVNCNTSQSMDMFPELYIQENVITKDTEIDRDTDLNRENLSLCHVNRGKCRDVDMNKRNVELCVMINKMPSSVPSGDDKEIFTDDLPDVTDGQMSDEDSLDSFLDFGAETLKPSSKINIISNVVVRGKEGQNTQHSPPWRFKVMKRNQHYILIKDNALPCLQQDMVLDYNEIQKIEKYFSATPRRLKTPKKSPVQKSILEYVSCRSPQRHNNKENVQRSSLFDYDDFSPIKVSSPQKNLRNNFKRNILGAIQDNAANGVITSTPEKKTGMFADENGKNVVNDSQQFFGFDREEQEMSIIRSKRSKELPFRIKAYSPKRYAKRVVEAENEVGAEESQVLNDNAEESAEVQLFDDPEKDFSLSAPSKVYEIKRRRKRLKSVEPENEEEHPKKRKKDMMTRAEEAALEEWAEKFNSMCKEVEKYNLEIE